MVYTCRKLPIFLYFFLATNDFLKVLDLSWNHLRLRGATAIGRALQVCFLQKQANLPTTVCVMLGAANIFNLILRLLSIKEEFEDTKGAAIICKSEKDRHHNGQQKKDRHHNGQQKKDRHHNGQQKKDRHHNGQQKKDRHHNGQQKKDRHHNGQQKKDRHHNGQQKKDRHHNGQQKKDRHHNGQQKKDRHHNGQQKKDRHHNGQQKKDRHHNGQQKKDRHHNGQQKKDRHHNGQQKKDRHHNGQQKKDRHHNGQQKKDRHHNGQQKKDRQHIGQQKKDRHHNGQQKKDRHHNGQRKRTKGRTTIYKKLHTKLKIEYHEPHLKPGVNLGTPEELSVPALLVPRSCTLVTIVVSQILCKSYLIWDRQIVKIMNIYNELTSNTLCLGYPSGHFILEVGS